MAELVKASSNGRRMTRISAVHVTEVMRYLSYLIQELRLSQWTVVVSDIPTTPEEEGESPPAATIHPNHQRYCAVIQVSPQWAGKNDEEHRDTLVHEMLHLVTRDMRSRVQFWGMQMARKDGDMCGAMHMDTDVAEELLVDHLTTVLAPRLAQYPGPVTDPIPNVRREGEWS